MTNPVLDFLQISRPGWWLVSAWLYVAPCNRYNDIEGRTAFDWIGFALVLLPLNVMVYGGNDLSDRKSDLGNSRKGNIVFGPVGWSKERIYMTLVPASILLVLTTTYWSIIEPSPGDPYQFKYLWWMIVGVLINGLYNQHWFRGKPLMVLLGYAQISLLGYWRNCERLSAQNAHLRGDVWGWEHKEDAGRWYFGGCNQQYWIHLTFLIFRTLLWTDLLDYDLDKRHQKFSSLSWLRTKDSARRIFVGFLLLETGWCYHQFAQYGRDWVVLFGLSCTGLLTFVGMDYVLPRVVKAEQGSPPPKVDWTWLALVQNAVGAVVLYDCWSRGTFVK